MSLGGAYFTMFWVIALILGFCFLMDFFEKRKGKRSRKNDK